MRDWDGMDIEDGIVIPVSAAQGSSEDDDSDFDGDFFTPKGKAIRENIYEVEV